MKSILFALAALAAMTPAALSAQPEHTPLDRDLEINGVGVACTGIGQTKSDPHWTSYPVRIEFSNAKHEYLAGAVVEVQSKRRHLLAIRCEGPWVLLKLAPGSYTVRATLQDSAAQPKTVTVRPPAHGQTRFVIEFPDA